MKANKETEAWYLNRIKEEKYTLTREGELISFHTKKPMSKELISSGYHRWRSYDKYKKSRYILVHRLMYLWFIGSLEDTDQINHIDNNKLNNSLDNLEKSNNSLNQIHRIKTSTHNTVKLDKNKVLEIYTLHKKGLLSSSKRKEICEKYDITPPVISNIISGRNWNYYTGVINE